MNPSTHVLLTRYNLPSGGIESSIRAKEGWLRTRTQLFDGYTVPSVRAQTSRAFRWIVYLDPASPQWLIAHMESLRTEGLLTPILRPSVNQDELRADIRAVSRQTQGRLLTTNLDNDDGLAVDFTARLQNAAVRLTRRQAIYVTNGIIASGDAVYLRRDPDNAFCSVSEDISDAVTCWVDWHNRLRLHMPVQQLDGEPGWLQVIHTTNVSNRVRGRRVSPVPYRGAFPGSLDEMPPPDRATLVFDRTVLQPYRLTRDRTRTMLRASAIRVLGKEGYGKAKENLSKAYHGARQSHR